MGFEKTITQTQKKVQEVRHEVEQVTLKTVKLGVNVKSLGEDVEQLEDDFDELQQALENIDDNNMRRNNIQLKGLKEGVEGNDLKVFLQEIFTASLGADSEIVIRICLPGRNSKGINYKSKRYGS